jgi:hypothetical protein
MHLNPYPGAMKLRKRRKRERLLKTLSACGEGFRVGLRNQRPPETSAKTHNTP